MCEKETDIKINPFNSRSDILIGQDNCQLISLREFYELKTLQFHYFLLLVGLDNHGRFSKNSSNLRLSSNNCLNICYNLNSNNNPEKAYLDSLDEIIKQFFGLDILGVNKNPRVHSSNKRACEILEQTSRRISNAWVIGLLWKDYIDCIPDSRVSALNRLRLLERKFSRDPEYAKLFTIEINRLFGQGCAVRACGPLKGRT